MKRKLRRQVEKLPEHLRKKFELKLPKDMQMYTVALSCGCCEANLFFSSDSKAKTAIKEAGLGSMQLMTDELGNEVDHVDTFYGICKKPIEEHVEDQVRYLT